MESSLFAREDDKVNYFLLCRQNPTLSFCDQVPSYYEYRLLLAPYVVFIALFGVSLIAFILTYALKRRALGFTIALVLGVVTEIIGYVGRVMSWKNQWEEPGFMIQICCLTIAPAFIAAGLYLCLRRIVFIFGPQNSRLKPQWYTRTFIPCDVLALILQATGGAMASIATHNHKSADTGNNIMMAGLAFQVLVLLIFMGVSLDFGVRVWRRYRAVGVAAFSNDDPRLAELRSSRRLRLFLAALVLATVCVFWRSVFRVAELSGGWSGPLMARQDLFIGFEGVLIVFGCLMLNIGHPALCVGDLFDQASKLDGRDNSKVAEKRVIESSDSA